MALSTSFSSYRLVDSNASMLGACGCGEATLASTTACEAVKVQDHITIFFSIYGRILTQHQVCSTITGYSNALSLAIRTPHSTMATTSVLALL